MLSEYQAMIDGQSNKIKRQLASGVSTHDIFVFDNSDPS